MYDNRKLTLPQLATKLATLTEAAAKAAEQWKDFSSAAKWVAQEMEDRVVDNQESVIIETEDQIKEPSEVEAA